MTYNTLKRGIFLLMNILFFNSYLVLGQTCYSTWNARIQYAQDSTNSLGTPYQVSKIVHNYTLRFANVNSEPKSNVRLELTATIGLSKVTTNFIIA